MMKKPVISILLAFLMTSMAACSSIRSLSDVSEGSLLKPDEAAPESGDSMAEGSAESRNDIASAQYEIGDIIFADGSMAKEADLTTIDSGNVPIAVIAGFREDGTAFGVGVHRSNVPLQWASDDSDGYTTNFADTVCTQESDLDFSGDMDGEDNWKAICVQDSEDTSDAAANYPAFHFVNTYASNYNLSDEM